MKKLIALFLILALCLSAFAGCSKEEDPGTTNPNGGNNTQNGNEPAKSDLKAAISYLESMYQTGKKTEPMSISMDKDLVSTVVVGGISYNVSWSVSVTEGASDAVKIGESSKEGHVLLDVESSTEEILFTATATVKDSEGKSDAISFSYKIPASAFAGKTDAEIVEMAYALEQGASMESAATLTAKIVQLKSPYDPDYGNITIVVAVEGLEDKPIECYRLKGDKVSNDLCVGDTVTVSGILKNYNGTIEFDAGCILDNVVSCGIVKPTDAKQIVDLAFALPGGESLPYFTTLTGVVKSIDSAYTDQYKNVTLTIEVEGTSGKKDLVCYRMKGLGVDVVAAGDTITVTGVIKNYVKDDKSTVEFDSGCIMDSRVPGEGNVTPQPGPGSDVPAEKPTTVDGIIKAAKALKENEELPYTVELTGKVTSVDEEYSEQYGNIIVTANFNGTSMKCYRMKVSADKIPAEGDTITVEGTIKNYYGKLQFVNSTCTKLVKGEKAPSSETAIVDAAYNLASGETLDYVATLTGTVTDIKTAYDPTYKNITVIIAVPGRENKPIECFRMKGDGADKITVGDTITVSGTLKNYNGTIEFDANCKMTKRISSGIEIPTNPKEIVDAAFALQPGKALPYTCTLTGKIKSIDTEYSEQYKNITVTIEVEGTSGKKDLVCYRMKGDGAADLKVGDTINVTGVIKNHLHSDGVRTTVEFDAGCTFTK